MKLASWRYLTSIILLCAVFATPSQAQEPEPTAPRAAQATTMVEEIREEYLALERLREQEPEDSSMEARALLERQLADEEIRVGKLLHELAELVTSAGDDESLQPVRAQLIEWLERLPAMMGEVIDRRTEIVEALRLTREQAAPEDRLAAEQQFIAAGESLNEALGFYASHVPMLEEFDIDAGAARAEAVERLQQRAETLATRISVIRDDQKRLRQIVQATPDDPDAKLRVLDLASRLDAAVVGLRSVAEALRVLDVDTSDYQKLLVQVTGNVSDVGLNTSVISSLVSDWFSAGMEWLGSSGPKLLGNFLVVGLIMALALVLARGARHLVRQAFRLRQGSTSMLLQRTAAKLVGQLIILLGVLMALSQVGISVGPMLAGLGIAGFVIAFALQDTLSNFASGAFILFYRPFDVGDVVEAGGVNGKVLNMTLVSTTILTFDNQTLIVPNQKIWGDVIRNVTAQRTRRVDLVFGIGYDDDIERAERVLEDILTSDDRVLTEPAPVVRLHELADSSVNFLVRPWVNRDDYWDVYWDVTRTVKMRFDAEGIGIPFPQRDVHHYYPQGRPPGASGSSEIRQSRVSEADADSDDATPDN